jgi:hypothetical protein
MIKLKLLGYSDETFEWFSCNSWVIQLKFVDDSAETLG